MSIVNESYASRAENRSVFTFRANGDLMIENAVIINNRAMPSNWAGNPTKVNPRGGKRTFNVVLNQAIAEELEAQGWNIKHFEPRSEDEAWMHFTEIVVNMESQWPPKIWTRSELNDHMGDFHRMTAATVGELDNSRFAVADIVIHPSTNPEGSKFMYKGYLNSAYITLAAQSTENVFGGKYANCRFEEDE